MTTLYKKGSQYHIKFGGVYYDVDIIKSKDDKELSELKKDGWLDCITKTVEKPKPKAKPKAKAKADKE